MAGSGAETQCQQLDKAASGLIYGAIIVLAVLMTAQARPPGPFEGAVVLFGSTLAITLAKAFSSLLAQALGSGQRITLQAWRAAWDHSSPTLAVANLPAVLFLAAAFGWLTTEQAVAWSQGICVAILVALGARVGWVIDRRSGSAVLGGLFAGGVGLGLALMKYVIHENGGGTPRCAAARVLGASRAISSACTPGASRKTSGSVALTADPSSRVQVGSGSFKRKGPSIPFKGSEQG